MGFKTLKYQNVWYRQASTNSICGECAFKHNPCEKQSRLFHRAHSTGVEGTAIFCHGYVWITEPEWVDDDAHVFEVISRLTGETE